MSASCLAAAENDETTEVADVDEEGTSCAVFSEDYLCPESAAGGKAPVIWRPRNVRTENQTIHMTLWMAHDFPLNFKEQILPIINISAPTNRHLAKLRDFVSFAIAPRVSP